MNDTPDPRPYPIPESDDALLSECRMETFGAGGPGGQHQNRTESAVRLTHLPTGIQATAREERSQSRNKVRALERLREKLEQHNRVDPPRKKTRPSRAQKEKRLDEKRKRSQLKRTRKKPEPE